MKPRESDEYPHAIQRAGKYARRVFDRVEKGLLADGYPQELVDVALGHDLDQILAQAKIEEEADRARKSRSTRSKKPSQ